LNETEPRPAVTLLTSPQLARLTRLLSTLGLASVNHAGRHVLKWATRDTIRVWSDGLVLQGSMENLRTLSQISRGTFEPFEVELFKQAVRPGMTVVDVGANIGYYTLLAARLAGPSGTVYAFEPDPRTFTTLDANVRGNGLSNVFLIAKAASDRSDIRELHMSRTAQYSGLYSYAEMDSVVATTPVETVAIDDVLQDDTVDVIKMDVEGEEAAALRGLSHALAASSDPRLFLEFNPVTLAAAGVSAESFLGQLRTTFRNVLVIDERQRRLVPIGSERLTKRVNLYLRGYVGGRE